MGIQKKIKSKNLELFIPDTATELDLPLVEADLVAGFPSPADDYIEKNLDLNKELIKNPSSTFLGRVQGTSMKDSGFSDGDILVIDKSLLPKSNSIMVCFIDGEFTVKRITENKDGMYLIPDNKDFKPIKINPDSDFRLWGVVTYSIKKHF